MVLEVFEFNLNVSILKKNGNFVIFDKADLKEGLISMFVLAIRL